MTGDFAFGLGQGAPGVHHQFQQNAAAFGQGEECAQRQFSLAQKYHKKRRESNRGGTTNGQQ